MATLLREAWATLVPDPAGRDGRLPPLMLLLTVVTGLVDAVSYLELGRVFVANMTGNVVCTGSPSPGRPASRSPLPWWPWQPSWREPSPEA